MKKLNYLMYALAIAGSLFTISCNKDDDKDSGPSYKKVSAVVYKNYEGVGTDDSTVFIYDSKGFLTKVEEYEVSSSSKTLYYSYEFQYVKNIPVSLISYEWEGTTKIADDKDSIGYDSKNRVQIFFEFDVINGKFVKEEDDSTTVSYGANNLPSRYTYYSTGYMDVEYTGNNVSKTKDYDDGVLKRTTTFAYDTKKNPFKGNPFYLTDFSYDNDNNCTSEVDNYGTENSSFEYNSEGYPTKVTTIYTYNNSKKSGTIHSQLSKLSRMRTKMGAMESSTDVMKIYYK